MTVNAFLLEPIIKLSKHYHVSIVVNDTSENISEKLGNLTILTVPIVRKISPFHDLFTLYKLIRIFRANHFKAVHSVTPKAGLLAMLASFFAGVSTRIHIFTGQVWVTHSGLSRFVFKLMDRLIASFSTDILVDSASQRQFLLDERVVNSVKSSVLAKGSISGVNTARFKPDKPTRSKLRQELAINERDVVFLFIGRLNRDKGVLDLATAFSKIKDNRAHLLIVGPDEVGIQPEMELLLGNSLERVNFIGFSSQPEEYMAAADVLCLPSYREGFGSVVIEAAAVGIPTVGSRIYGVEDAIADGHSGLLFQAGNVEELLIQMMKFLSDNELGKSLGANARKRVLAQFSSETLATAWLDYYQARI